MKGIEQLFMQVLRAGNILIFFFSVYAAIRLSSGMTGDWRFLIIAGAAIFSAMSCGGVALAFRISDQLDEQGKYLKSSLSAQRHMAEQTARQTAKARAESPQ